MRKLILILMVIFSIAGCVAGGVSSEQMTRASSKFVVGKTTYQEVIAELGKDFGMAVTPDGKRHIVFFEYGGDRNQFELAFDKNDVLETKKLKF